MKGQKRYLFRAVGRKWPAAYGWWKARSRRWRCGHTQHDRLPDRRYRSALRRGGLKEAGFVTHFRSSTGIPCRNRNCRSCRTALHCRWRHWQCRSRRSIRTSPQQSLWDSAGRVGQNISASAHDYRHLCPQKQATNLVWRRPGCGRPVPHHSSGRLPHLAEQPYHIARPRRDRALDECGANQRIAIIEVASAWVTYCW